LIDSSPDKECLLKASPFSGRWHRTDCSGGYALYETSNAAALFEGAAKWADVLQLHTVAVVEDADAGAAFAKVFNK
jgi:hypothetical protein